MGAGFYQMLFQHLYSQYLTKEVNTYNGLNVVYSINDVGEIGQIRAEK